MASIGSNSVFDGMQPRLTHSDAMSALSPMKKSTRAPSLAAVWAAVKPAEPPPRTAIVRCALISASASVSARRTPWSSDPVSECG
jgi:hypothetical protein